MDTPLVSSSNPNRLRALPLGMFVLVSSGALVVGALALIGPSAAIALATLITAIATVLSLQERTPNESASAEPLSLAVDIESAFDSAPPSQPVSVTAIQMPLVTCFPDPFVEAAAASVVPKSTAELGQELEVALIASPVAQPEAQGPSWTSGVTLPPSIKNLAGALQRLNVLVVACTAGIGLLLAWMLLAGVDQNPVGFFADEAEIGVRTHDLIFKQLTSLRPPVFYNHFGYHHLGALPLYATAPFVAIFGLTEQAVRLASAFWSLAAVGMLVLLVRRLKWNFGEVGVLAFAFSPVYIHVSRISFGHAPSLFCSAAGLYCFVRAKQDERKRWAVLAGAAFGLSIYGHAASYIATPIVVSGLMLGEMVSNHLSWRRYRALAITVVSFGLAWIPVFYQALTNDDFMRRFNDKQFSDARLLSRDRLNIVIDNYGKYFNLDYFFRTGEVGMPGAFIQRHSVRGAGELLWITLPLVLLGIVAIFRCKEPIGRTIGITGLVALLLYPVPDVISTNSLTAPYTFSLFPTMIFVPLLGGFGVHLIVSEMRARRVPFGLDRAVAVGLAVVILIGGVNFYRGPYAEYPKVSAGYYGWQYGPEQAIARFQAYRQIYDRFYLDGDFNEAYVFLDFYLQDDPDLRSRTQIGGFERSNLADHELFAVRRERYDALLESTDRLRNYVQVVDVIRDPNGEIVLYLVDIQTLNYDRTPEEPR